MCKVWYNSDVSVEIIFRGVAQLASARGLGP